MNTDVRCAVEHYVDLVGGESIEMEKNPATCDRSSLKWSRHIESIVVEV